MTRQVLCIPAWNRLREARDMPRAKMKSTATESTAARRTDVDRRDASTRELILDTALAAFSEHGFDGASTRSISTRAGVNQGLIPYYFGSKQALWREAVDRAFVRLDESLADLGVGFEASDRDSIDRDVVAQAIRRYIAFVGEHPEFVRLMNEEGKRSGARMEWLADRHVRPRLGWLQSLLRRTIPKNPRIAEIPPIHFTYIFLGATSLIFHQAHECRHAADYDPTSTAAVEAHADAIVELFLGDARLGRIARRPQ